MTDGLTYQHFTYHETQCHLLSVDLTKRSVRPVLAAEAFPIKMSEPIKLAIEQGALACGVSGFNMQWSHLQGISDQPLHALVVDREIWTTGIGAGGYGVLIGDKAHVQQNRIRVVVWRPDGSSFEVEDVNRGHNGRIVAFTARGGTNEYPVEGKHYVALTPLDGWTDVGHAIRRRMGVSQVSMFDPIRPFDQDVVLEARWPMRLHEGDEVTWIQRLGAPHVRYVVSGATGIIKDGINNVPLLHLDPESPRGPDNWYLRVGPRSALGVSKDHKTFYMATVEGRVPNSYRPKDKPSKGLRLKEFATMLLQHGIHDAVNMDGGGSAFMWYDGKLVAPGCYNDEGTISGLRPDHYVMSVF